MKSSNRKVKWLAFLLTIITVFQSAGLSIVSYAEQETSVNIALGKKASASDSETDYFTPEKAFDGNRDREQKPQSRWTSNTAGGKKWLQVDLGAKTKISEIRIDWERRNAADYEIQVSSDNNNWRTIYTGKEPPKDFYQTIPLEQEWNARYVRLMINAFNRDSEGVDWNVVSVFELEVYGIPPVIAENLALNKPAKASDQETDYFTPAKAVDGDADRNKGSQSQSRWSSSTATGVKWIMVDLGSVKPIQTVVVDWERRNVTDYEIQVSNNNKDWNTVFHGTEPYFLFREKITLNDSVEGRYVRVLISAFDSNSEGVDWNVVSIFEFEVYSEVLQDTLQEKADKLIMPEQPKDSDVIVLPASQEMEIRFLGADYDLVVDYDGKINRPIVDTEVKVDLEAEHEDEIALTGSKSVVIPGIYGTSTGNEKPVVIPEIREWYGTKGKFSLSAQPKFIVDSGADEDFMKSVEAFSKDYYEMYQVQPTVSKGDAAEEGSIFFSVNDQLGKEGYLLEIEDALTVKSSTHIGAFWATRTILQILKNNEGEIPKGIARDYPKWEIRGFMIDAGRKTFSFEFLNEIMKEMSWYKMNDFHVHLNDNFIFLEDYMEAGEDPFDAYAGFRLESVVPGVTSTDMFYSKADFREFILDSRARGVNIVPEIDVPAHSLAFTKIRKDLALSENGRDAEKLSLINPETLPFVKSIFNEFLDGQDPLFDKSQVIHVGTDEYSNTYREEFRKFTDDMIKFIQDDKDRTVRIWGSLTARSGNTPVRSEGVQMNLWNTGWANPLSMYKDGFDLINTLDSNLYIVPDAGYYSNYLNTSNLYNNWEANNFNGTVLPISSKQVLGGTFAFWHDQIDKRNNGASEIDAYDRINDAMPTLAQKLWGEGKDLTYNEMREITSENVVIPGVNLRRNIESKSEKIIQYDFDGTEILDKSGNDYHPVKTENIELSNSTLILKGGKSYVETNLGDIALEHTLQFRVQKSPDADMSKEQILFEAEVPAGKTTVKMSQNGSGKLGFTRENMDYTFDYSLPEETVNIAIYSELGKARLYENGKLIQEIKREKVGNFYPSMNASILLPLDVIGSKTDSFEGIVYEVNTVKGEKPEF